jgi:hypothetical protein
MGAGDKMKEAIEGGSGPLTRTSSATLIAKTPLMSTMAQDGRAEPHGTGPQGSASPTGS